MEILRKEHPMPQWEREDWRNLNGEWEFEFDFGKSAREREVYKEGKLSKKINVPFCPESELSGIGYKDFIMSVCYRKVITLTKAETEKNVFLHFGAVDYESFIYINGVQAGHHIGGFSSFSVDITNYVKEGENTIFVIAEDDVRCGKQAVGKQSSKYASESAWYTRTTGIWQTVWLEFTEKNYIKNAKYFTDIDNGILTIQGEVEGSGKLLAEATFNSEFMGRAEANVFNNTFNIQIKLNELHLWELGKGDLYNLELTFCNDRINSYFGMRSVALKNKKFYLNNKCVFQRTVLDQGFYPDGLYTAKSDDDLINDIKISMDLGFNGARLHQKIFEPRFLYHCDRLGYMVWGEHGNWGVNYENAVAFENFTNEWIDTLERDFNHPSIIGWCPLNETWGYAEKNSEHRFVETIYQITKKLDKTRLVIDVSGNFHCDNIDIFDVHDYEQDVENFREYYSKIGEGILLDQIERQDKGLTQNFKGEAVFVSEYGGIGWKVGEIENGWGYGNNPKTEDEFYARYKGLTDTLLDNPYVMGFCYTQLYDIEQEINGIYTFDRKPKFDIEKIREINLRKAKIEELSEKEDVACYGYPLIKVSK